MHRVKYTKLTPEQIAGKLVAMAREQGGGTVTRTHRGSIEDSFVKQARAWTLERATFRPDS